MEKNALQIQVVDFFFHFIDDEICFCLRASNDVVTNHHIIIIRTCAGFLVKLLRIRKRLSEV